MGIYAKSNAGSAKLVALAAVLGGYALVAELTRPSGFIFALGGTILFLGVGEEVSPTTTHDILPTLAFLALMALGVSMYAAGH